MSMHKQMIGKIGPGSAPNDITLADYIARKEVAYSPRLTFEEWWKINGIGGEGLYNIAKEAWKAAQENM